MVLLVTIYTIVRGTIFSIITINPEGLIPLGMGSILLFIIYKRSIHTQAALIGWSLFFIIKYGTIFFGLILSHHHRNYQDLELISFLEKTAFFLLGIVIWIGSYRYVEIHESIVDPTKSEENGK